VPTDPTPFPTEIDDQPTHFSPPSPPARHDRSTVAGSYLKQNRGNQKKKDRDKERKQK
jgi:hypothetical protein